MNDPDFAAAVRAALSSLPAAAHLGLEVGELAAGTAELHLRVRPEHTQGGGLVAGSVLGALADLAGGAAVGTLLPAGWTSVTSSYTVSVVAPAKGQRLVARGRVVHPGRSTSVAAVDVSSAASTEEPGRESAGETLCATALVTMRNLRAG